MHRLSWCLESRFDGNDESMKNKRCCIGIIYSFNLNFNIKRDGGNHVMDGALTGTHWVTYVTDSNWSLMMADKLFSAP